MDSPLSWVNWNSGQPRGNGGSSTGTDNCVVRLRTNVTLGKWNDVDCTTSLKFYCDSNSNYCWLVTVRNVVAARSCFHRVGHSVHMEGMYPSMHRQPLPFLGRNPPLRSACWDTHPLLPTACWDTHPLLPSACWDTHTPWQGVWRGVREGGVPWKGGCKGVCCERDAVKTGCCERTQPPFLVNKREVSILLVFFLVFTTFSWCLDYDSENHGQFSVFIDLVQNMFDREDTAV